MQYGDNLRQNTVNMTTDGKSVEQIAMNSGSVVALLTGGVVRTFGSGNMLGMSEVQSQFGTNLGDNEDPAELGSDYVPILSPLEVIRGMRVSRVYAGGSGTACAVLAPSGGLRCWGSGLHG